MTYVCQQGIMYMAASSRSQLLNSMHHVHVCWQWSLLLIGMHHVHCCVPISILSILIILSYVC